MIKKLTSTAVATLTILTMMNTGAVFADSKDANEKEPVALVNVEKLNIRSGPSTSYDIIGSFEKEDSVDLISIKDGWYKIKLEDGKKAWTNGQYITLDGEVTVDKLQLISNNLYFNCKLYILIMSIEILNYWRFLMRDIDYGTVRIKLNELIELQGISKNRLAHRAEMQRTQLNQYCNGEVTRLDIAVLARLCCALDCKVEDLLEYVPPEQE